MPPVKHYSVTAMPVAASRDSNGIYFVRTPQGFNLLRVDETINKNVIPLRVDWDNIDNKPSLAPSVHTHDASDITSGVLSVNRIPNLDYIPLSGSNQITGGLIRNVTSTNTWVATLLGVNAVTPAVIFRFGVYGMPANDFYYAYMSFHTPDAQLGAPFKLHMNGYVGLGLTGTSSPTERLDVNGQVRIRTLNSAAGDVVTTSATGILQKQTPSQIVVAGGGITTESDPTVPAHVKAITTNDIAHWDDAYSWGNHSAVGYEEATNKAQDFTTVNQTLYPSIQAVVDYINDEKDVAQWNANKLQGTDLLLGTPSNGHVLIYDGGWKNIAPPWLTSNQTIVLSGDVTGSGATSISTTIANNAVTTAKIANSNVTLAKIQNIASYKLLGNPFGTSVAPSEISIGEGLELNSAGQQLNSVFRVGVTAEGNTLIKRTPVDINGNQVRYIDRSGMGHAYNVRINPTNCYEVKDEDERFIFTKEGTWGIKLPTAEDYPNRTLKFTLLFDGVTVNFTNAGCEIEDTVLSSTNGTSVFNYLQSGELATTGESARYSWIEIQSVKLDDNKWYWVIVECGNIIT